MRLFCSYILLVLFGIAWPLSAATQAESHAFKSATKLFEERIFVLAEKNFANFLEKFPTADRRPEAVLYVAKARYYQTNYDGAITLLKDELPQAEAFKDQYQYWIGESHFRKGNFTEAAASYGELCHDFPQSPLRLEACYSQAFAFSKMQNRGQVIALLGKPDGDFQTTAKKQLETEPAINGFLLLSETLVAEKRFAEAEIALKDLNGKLAPEVEWRKEFLEAKIQLADGRLEGALQSSTNLLNLAAVSGQKRLKGESVFLQAQILEKANRLLAAIEAYEQNLADELPVEMRRQALFKIFDLTLQQQKNDEAVKRLENFIQQNPGDPALDLARLSLGELQLKGYFASRNPAETNLSVIAAGTNLLQQALTNFNAVRTNFSQSEFLGKALLDRGWCLWIDSKFDEAENSFAEAVTNLTLSVDQAVARFKLADCQFRRQDYTNAVANYTLVVQNYGQFSGVTNVLFDQALYQMVRGSVAMGNQAIAEEAMTKILTSYPNSFFSDRSLLIFGQDLNRRSNPQEARAAFNELVSKFPNSSLLPEAELAIAQTYVQERQWESAIKQFEIWKSKFTNHVMIPDAEFSRGLAYAQAGMETNALDLFTNFVARFPTNNLAARAQNWVADYYFNHEKFAEAEASYQLVNQNYKPQPELAYQAKLGAGRAAFERQGFDEALQYFRDDLINDTNTPTSILGEAYFALADTLFAQFLQSTNKTEDSLGEAIHALTKAINLSTNSPMAARAWGRIGEFHFQLAMLKTNDAEFGAAQEAYQNVLNSEFADAQSRNDAEVRMGKVYEKQGDTLAALEHYLKVVNEEDLDKVDARWVKEAGIAAAKILENREEWDQAVNVYKRLIRVLPALETILDKKINAAQAHLDKTKN